MGTMTADRRAAVLADPGFGRHLTDHLVTARFAGGTWSALEVEPMHDLVLSPAAMVLHYGQAIFEGLKAYRQPDGSLALFRPHDNAARFDRSAARMAMPALPDGLFVDAVNAHAMIENSRFENNASSGVYLKTTVTVVTGSAATGNS